MLKTKKRLLLSGGLLLLILSSAFIFLGAREKRELTESELLHYLADPANGLWKEYESGNTRIEVQAMPAELVWKNSKGFNTKDYADYRYFQVKVSKDGKDLETWFYQQTGDLSLPLERLSGGMQSCFYIKTPEGNVYPEDCLFTRSFGMQPFTTFRLVFSREKLPETETWIFKADLAELAGAKATFEFDPDKIDHLPKLKRN